MSRVTSRSAAGGEPADVPGGNVRRLTPVSDSLDSPLLDFSQWLAERNAHAAPDTESTDEAPVQETDQVQAPIADISPTDQGWGSHPQTPGTPREEVAEAELVNRAIAGEKTAFTALYDAYYDQIYRYVLYRVSSAEDAEDLAQMVFLQAWRAIGRYKVTGSPFVAWLFTIAHNLVVSFYRRNRTTVPLDQDVEEVRRTSHPEVAAESVLDQERTRTAILKLRPDHQKVIHLRFIENLAHRDIALSMGKTEGAVRVIQHRALVELRRILELEEAA